MKKILYILLFSAYSLQANEPQYFVTSVRGNNSNNTGDATFQIKFCDISDSNKIMTLQVAQASIDSINRRVDSLLLGKLNSSTFNSYKGLVADSSKIFRDSIASLVTQLTGKQASGSYATTTQLDAKLNTSDTASLSNALRIRIPTNNNQLTNGSGYITSFDTTNLSNRINQRLKHTDTSAMLANLYTSLASKVSLSAISATGNLMYTSGTGVIQDYLSWVTTHVPTTGQSIQLIKGTNLVNPATSLLALTIVFPSSPTQGDILRIVFTKTITTLTMSSGVTIVNNLITTILGSAPTYQYIGTSWYKVGSN